MKPILMSLLLLACALNSYGQVTCKIKYSYDANGQRTKRVYECSDPKYSEDLHGTFRPIAYPNPNDGVFTVSFEELVRSARIIVNNMEGVMIAQYSMEEGYDRDIDIRYAVPGSYLVNIYVVREDNTEASESLVVIKDE